MAFLAPLLLGGGTLVSAGLSIAGGIMAQKNAEAEAQMRRKIGKAEADDQRRQSRRLIASQQVAFAKAGVATGVGTPLDVLGDTVAEEELKALRIRFSRNLESDALKRKGDMALFQGIVGGLNTILGGVGDGAFGNPFSSAKTKAIKSTSKAITAGILTGL